MYFSAAFKTQQVLLHQPECDYAQCIFETQRYETQATVVSQWFLNHYMAFRLYIFHNDLMVADPTLVVY
jgi:hypothetical protein